MPDEAQVEIVESDIARRIEIIPIAGISEVKHGDEIADLILSVAGPASLAEPHTAESGDVPAGGKVLLADGDVLVVTQKIVSKAEGRVVAVDPDDPRSHGDAIESEAVRILRRRGDLVIAETRHGFVCASAGVDRSNMEPGTAALLPLEPDRSAHRIRAAIRRSTKLNVAVIVTDTFGRAWRRGQTDVAIGCSGIGAIIDLRGSRDAHGRELHFTEICIADEIAGAAELVMGKSSGIPVAIVRGVDPSWFRESSVKAEVVRPAAEDLFR